MRLISRNLLYLLCLTLFFSASAFAADRILWDEGGEDVSYDSKTGLLVDIGRVAFPPSSSLLPGAVPPPLPLPGVEKPAIAIIIDDVGLNRRQSRRAVRNLKAPVTLSYLAYAPDIQDQVDEARKRGHEVMLHLPWEADRETANPGPHHLSVGMKKERLQKSLLANLDGFKGYTGVNNHMGSKFSRYRPGLEIVMKELKKRSVFFLDSKTTPDSIAERVARENGLPTLHRNVFLDHVEKPEFVTEALHEVEAVAARRGSAIAIGHPKDLTLAALEAWIPLAEAKGFRFVSVSELMKERAAAASESVAKK